MLILPPDVLTDAERPWLQNQHVTRRSRRRGAWLEWSLTLLLLALLVFLIAGGGR